MNAAYRLLGGQAHPAGTDQAGEWRLEPPEGAADCTLKEDVAVVGAAEREVCRRQVAVRHRHEPEDDAARIDLQDAAEPGRGYPQIAFDVVVETVRATIAGHVSAGLDAREGQPQRVTGRARRAHPGAGGKGGVQHAAGGAVTNCQRVVVGRYRDPVRKLQVVHYFPQHTVLRVLVHRPGAVGHVRP